MTRIALFLVLGLATAGAVVPGYFAAGFSHVIPDGLDHVLFILGLFFLSRNFAVMLFQLTLFTLAHSLTLGLSLYGWISVPTSVVEIAIALSISFIALENLVVRDQLKVWRPWVVFGFGLVHGLGFAHSFAETPIPGADFLTALFSFNVGIEIGQIVVVGFAYGITALVWNRTWYRAAVVRPACLLIAAIGIYMTFQRVV